jgi:hypothetical protein
VLTVRRGGLDDRRARTRERAGRHRARKHELLDAEATAGVEQDAHGVDVGSPVLGVVLAGEVIVRREVDHHLRAAAGRDAGHRPGERIDVAQVDRVPLDVGVAGELRLGERPAIDRQHDVASPQQLDQQPSQEAGGAGHHHAHGICHRLMVAEREAHGRNRPATPLAIGSY